MSEDLAEFLLLHRLKATAADLAKLVTDVMAEKAATARSTSAGAREGSVIEGLIQEEMLRFTSLGDGGTSPANASAVTPAQPEDGSRPLDANEFMNLTDWAPSLVGDTFDPGLSGAASWDQPGARTSSMPGSLADELEGDVLDSGPPPRLNTPRPSPVSQPASAISQSPAPLISSSSPLISQPPVTQAQPPTSASIPIPLTVPSNHPPRPGALSSSPLVGPPEKKFPVAVVAIVAVVVVGLLGGLFATGVLHR